MKMVSVREAKSHFSACLEESQKKGVVVMNHGRPKSVVIGVEGYELEDIVLMLDPDFWKMIEARRRQPRTPLEDFEKELATPAPAGRKARRSGKKR